VVYPFYMKLIKIMLLFFFSLSVLAASEEDDIAWGLEKDKKGIQIYTGKSKHGKFMVYKAETVINSRLSNVFNFLQDTSVITGWLYNLKSIELLNIKDTYETDYYAIYSTPWPVSDVSAVLRATWQYDRINKLLKNSTISVDAGQYSDDGYMHIPLIETHNRFQQVGTNEVKLSFQVTIDHGYALPGLIVDTVSVETLYETLVNLKQVDYKKYNANNLLGVLPQIGETSQ